MVFAITPRLGWRVTKHVLSPQSRTYLRGKLRQLVYVFDLEQPTAALFGHFLE
jgi:hypothetical protein